MTKKRVYNALVLPHLDYCCVVWQEYGKVLQQKLERIQNYGMRLVCVKPPRTPSEDLRKSLRWTSLVDAFTIKYQVICLIQYRPMRAVDVNLQEHRRN